MLHHARTAGAVVAVSGATIVATVNTWFTVAASAATVVGAGVALFSLRRGRRRPKPKGPLMPAPLTIDRTVTKESYQRALAEWELYRARRDQFDQDQKGQL